MTNKFLNSTSGLLRFHAYFWGAVLVLHVLLRYLQKYVPFIMHQFWPLSVFTPSVPTATDALTMAAILFVFTLLILQMKRGFKGGKIYLLLVWLILLTTLFHGIKMGFSYPIYGHGERDYDYWSDTSLVISMGYDSFVESYTLLQPGLGYHSRVHPPGAVLLIASLRTILKTPLHMAVFLFLIASIILPLLYYWLARVMSALDATFITVLFGLLPVTHIYLYSGIDGFIGLIFLMGLYFWYYSEKSSNYWWALLFVCLGGVLTFAVFWLFLSMLVLTVLQKKPLKNIFSLGVNFGLFLLLLYWMTGYDYFSSFVIAHSFEGYRGGFYLFVQPASYIVTRIQTVLEIMVYVGPSVLLLVCYSLKSNKLTRITIAGIVSFVVFILGGAYYTSETPRAAFYMIPILLLGISPKVLSMMSGKLKTIVLSLSIFQAALMQLFGFYRW